MELITDLKQKVARVLGRERKDETRFVPPWEKYKKVASLVRRGQVEKALERPELGWLQRDLDGWVRDAILRPGSFDSKEVRFLDALSGITPDDSSLEGRIYQRWSAYPQIKAMMGGTLLGENIFRERIAQMVQHYQEHPEELEVRGQETTL